MVFIKHIRLNIIGGVKEDEEGYLLNQGIAPLRQFSGK